MVEKIAGWLLPEELLAALSDDEIAFLILACHYHDLGMAGTEADNRTVEGREQVRREHAISIGSRILADWQSLGFQNEKVAEILAEICKGHRPERSADGVATWDNLSEYSIVGPERDVRVRLIAAMVYAADELHIGEDRAPRREEEFNKIVNAENRTHWRRHQAVQGPVLRAGKLCFDGSVASPVFEKDLRAALRKAFQSVDELTGQLQRSKIDFRPVSLQFSWHRKVMWELLIAISSGDLIPRSKEEIADKVAALYEGQMTDAKDLSAFCTECVNGGAIQNEIKEIISDFITQQFLVDPENNGVYILDGKPRVTESLFCVARKADELDSLFLGQTPPEHEHRLYRSKFGRRFIREELYPRLKQDYLIDVVSQPDVEHLKTALESSPTAARIVQNIKPPSGVLVQSDLLEFACIAGACADLINDPELILNADYRHAITQLFDAGVHRLPKFLLFIEELAIIKKLPLDQASAAQCPTAGESTVQDDGPSTSFHISQQFPASRPDLSFGYLMLAQRRAGITITVQNNEPAPFQLKGLEFMNSEAAEDLETPLAITIGPGCVTPQKKGSFRAKVLYNAENNELSIEAQKLSPDDSGRPVLLQVFRDSDADVMRCNFRLINSELTVGDVRIFHEAILAFKNGDLKTAVTIEGNSNDPIESPDFADFASLYDELVERLAACDQSIPFPCVVPTKFLAQLTSCNAKDVRKELKSFTPELKAERPTITTIYLRLSTVDSQDYYEEFLGLQRPSFSFNAPTITGEGISQEDFEEKWKSGDDDIEFDIFFQEDENETAQMLRNWNTDPSQPFSFRLSGEHNFSFVKTRMSVKFERLIDRMWYLERRVTFRFRPVTKAERYHIEKEYWESEGDEERACLLNELLHNAIAEEERTSPN